MTTIKLGRIVVDTVDTRGDEVDLFKRWRADTLASAPHGLPVASTGGLDLLIKRLVIVRVSPRRFILVGADFTKAAGDVALYGNALTRPETFQRCEQVVKLMIKQAGLIAKWERRKSARLAQRSYLSNR